MCRYANYGESLLLSLVRDGREMIEESHSHSPANIPLFPKHYPYVHSQNVATDEKGQDTIGNNFGRCSSEFGECEQRVDKLLVKPGTRHDYSSVLSIEMRSALLEERPPLATIAACAVT
ncbi:hypothetical protein [Bradyrhizobium sp. UNPF46]|uniref:hypothetical protein n=1 Tax=Bradyrhizobium sp. UNPF46 TaxID=1141168 RepID=UPI00115247D7|nr:hypothetical protein [Bradyrhizobium sp. UNPF46]